MREIKKGLKFLSSMAFALVILGLFVLVCIAGSVIPQGEIQAVYESAYPGWSGLILGMGLDDVFHSWWFILLTLLLCGNLLGCNLVRVSPLVNKMKAKTRPLPTGEEGLPFHGDPEKLLKEMGFSKWEAMEGGRYAIRNKIGFWGAWLTHLGIFVIILGFALGQIFTVNYSVFGVPGEEKPIGDTGLLLSIDDFSIELRPDDTVEQYTASLTLKNPDSGEQWSGQTQVNHPWDAGGLRFYQNSTGWAADMAVYRGEELIQTDTLCAGEKITVSDYTILFANPRSYTLIQIKHDPFTWLAGAGGVLLLAALFVAFYLRTEELWLVPEGEDWRVFGRSRKGSLMFREKLAAKLEEGSK